MSKTKFSEARVMTTGDLISIVDLEKKKKDDPVLKQLGCPKCGARVVFRKYSEGKCSNLYSLEPHVPGCKYEVKHKTVDANRRLVVVGISSLSASEQTSRSKSAYYRFLHQYEEMNGDTNLLKKRGRSVSISRKPRDKNRVEKVPVVKGTVGKNADVKQSQLRKRIGSTDPLRISAENIGQTLEIVGVFSSMTVSKNSNFASIVISNQGSSTSLTMNEAFFSSAYVNYKKSLFQVLDVINSHPELLVIVSVVVEVIPGRAKGEFSSMIRSHSSLMFNGKSAAMFIHAYQ